MWHVLGNAPGGRNTHISGLVAHVDVGSWISLGVAVICISPDGPHIQHESGFEVPSTRWANPIVHVPKRRSKTRFFFANFQVGEVPVPIGFNHFLQFSKKLLKNEGRVVFLVFFFLRRSRGRSRFQHNTGNATTKNENCNFGGVTVRSFWALYIKMNMGNVAHGIK